MINAFACGEEIKVKFIPFAIEMKSHNQKIMKSYEMVFPITDSKKTDFFLSSFTAIVPSQFEVELNYIESRQYVGNYYSAYLTINESLINTTKIIVGYNSLDKDNTSLVFCGNFKEYSLTELLKNEPPEIKVTEPPKPLANK
jgi:hypothetical protein